MDTILSPLQGLNISFLYDRYSTATDFAVYAFLLIYACRIGLARTFGEAHSRSLGTVVGIMLAVSLSIAGKALGFNLRSFGPIAAMIVLFLVGTVIYSMMRHTGAGHLTSGSVAYVISYISVRAVSPTFFTVWSRQSDWAGYLDALLLLTVLVAVIRVVYSAFPSDGISGIKNAIDQMKGSSNQFTDSSRKQTKLEVSMVRKGMKTPTRQGRRECRQVMGTLKQLIRELRQNGANRDVASKAGKVLENLRTTENHLSVELGRIQAIDEKLLRFDLSQYRDLEQAYRKLSEQQKARCQSLFAQGRGKIGIEQSIRQLAVQSETYAIQFDRCLASACQLLRNGRSSEALPWMEKALAQEQLAERLLSEMRKHEKSLIHVMRQQLATLRDVRK